MRVLDRDCAKFEVNANLNDLASWHAEIVLQEIGALKAGLLRLSRLKRQAARKDKQHSHYRTSRIHLVILACADTNVPGPVNLDREGTWW